MTPKKNKAAKSANMKNDSNFAPNEKDTNKQANDPRLKSLLPLIATQLPPIQEVMIYYAKAFLDKTRALKSRQATLAKFKKLIPNNVSTANGLPTPSSTFYIPKSARVKITLTYSNALKNETEIKDLEEELKESIKDFGTRVAYIFERTAALEEKQEKVSRLHTFLKFCHKLTQGFVILAKSRFELDTNLNTEMLENWCLLILLRRLRQTSIAGLSIFDEHLGTNYLDVKTEYTNLFLPGYQLLENKNNDIFFRTGSDEERKFISAVAEQVEGLIIPSTFELQLELNKQEETQNLTSMIAARFKNNEILTATEATALAIHDTTSSKNTNLEQHIKNLIDEAINKKLTSTPSTKPYSSSPPTPSPSPHQNKKQKNSLGSKRPLPSLPKNERGEKKKKKKTVSFRYSINENNNEQQAQQVETETQQIPSKNQNPNPKHQPKNRNHHQQSENHEEKNPEARKGQPKNK